MGLLEQMDAAGLTYRSAGKSEGGEYSSSCPECGDGGKGNKSDRFRVWPNSTKPKLCAGRYWCRRCGIHGDTISFMQKFRGMSFPQACDELGIILPQRHNDISNWQRSPAAKQETTSWHPRSYDSPCETWRIKAEAFLADCQKRLHGHTEALLWLAKRGISAAAASRYGLGYNESRHGGDRYRPRLRWGLPEKLDGKGKAKKLWLPRGWVIPSRDENGHLEQLRIRRLDADLEKFCPNIKYTPVDGSSMATMVINPAARFFAVVECGFDAQLIASLFDGLLGVITTWNSSAKPDRRAMALLNRSSLVIDLLDYDAAGVKAGEWWKETFPGIVRPNPPRKGGKDPGKMFENGVDIRSWLLSELPPVTRIQLEDDLPAMESIKIPSRAVTRDDPPEITTPENSGTGIEEPEEDVVEIEMKNGTVIYVTDTREKWIEIIQQGQPVFSSNELERIKIVTEKMTEAQRADTLEALVACKLELGGYIREGRRRCECDTDTDE